MGDSVPKAGYLMMADPQTLIGREGLTPPEVERLTKAIRALSAADYRRLIAYGHVLCRKLMIQDGEDLLQEAIKRALSTDRDWPDNVPFLDFLFGTMRSIADSWRRNSDTVRRQHPQESEDEESGRTALMDSAESTRWLRNSRSLFSEHSNAQMPPDVQLIRQEVIQTLRQKLPPKHQALLEARLNGSTPSDIQARFGISSTGYQTLWKYMRRTIQTLRGVML